MNKKYEELGRNIKKAREDKGQTQEEIARTSEISSNYYAKIERGEVNTTFKKLYKIIKALKVTASDIFPD